MKLHEHIVENLNTPARQRENKGNISDIVKTWSAFYKKKGWHQKAVFDTKGNFNKPYCLFKAKNITDGTTRMEKWMKARPISPGTKHPMRKLFGRAGLSGPSLVFCDFRDELRANILF